MYHVENVIRETGNPVNDGLMSVYVNTEVAEDSLISELMQCFLKTAKEAARKTVEKLNDMGMDISLIASAVDMDEETIKQWLEK